MDTNNVAINTYKKYNITGILRLYINAWFYSCVAIMMMNGGYIPSSVHKMQFCMNYMVNLSGFNETISA